MKLSYIGAYAAGIATAAILAGAIYFLTQVGKLRGEDIVGSTRVNDTIVQIIREDKKWKYDDYRIEVLDDKGNIKVQFQGAGRKFTKAKIKNEGGLETLIPF